MSFYKSTLLPLLASVFLGSGVASATVVGLPSAPLGVNTWDTFSSSSGQLVEPSEFATRYGFLDYAATTGSGQSVLSGDGFDTNGNASEFSLHGSVRGTYTGMQLTIKFAEGAIPAANLFTTNFQIINGSGLTVVPGVESYLGSTTEGSNTFQIYQWTWANVSMPDHTNFTITVDGAADHVLVDALRINLIPEASTSLMSVAGACALLVRRRRD